MSLSWFPARPAAHALVACAVFVFVPGIAAQELSVRLGGLRARYADTLSGSAASIAPRLTLAGSRTHGQIEASFAQFATGGWAVTAAGEAAAWLDAGPGHLVLAASSSTNSLSSGVWSGQSLGHAVLGVPAGAVLVSLGGSLGVIRRVSGDADLMRSVALGAQPARSGSTLRFRVQFVQAGRQALGDAMLSVGRTWRAARFDADLGVRAFDGGATELSWQFAAALPIGGPLSVEASFGSWPRSFEGFASGRFATVGLRLTRGGSSRDASALTRFAATPRGAARVVVSRLAGQQIRITLPAPDASTVAIAFEHDNWTPHPMRPAGDRRWTAEVALPPGLHRFSLILDGVRWTVPEGVRTLPDDFGGHVGIIVIP